MKAKKLKITEFSKHTGLSIKALRLYEEKSLLKPQRSPDSSYRLYTDADILVAQRISSLREMGFSLLEIKEVLTVESKFRKLALKKDQVRQKLSRAILGLSSEQLLKRTKEIPNQEYIKTLALVSEPAKEKLLSVLSEKAQDLIRDDLKNLTDHYSQFWVGE